MATSRGNKEAFGAPGLEPRWTHGDKDGIGTAYSAASQLWFTLWNGIVTEIYYPTVDKPQLRDLQFLITDGKTFLHEETSHSVESRIQKLDDTLGYTVRSRGSNGEYEFEKTIIADPHLSALLIHTKFSAKQDGLKLYALCAPHLEVGGWGNSASVVLVQGYQVLVANKGDTWLAMACRPAFTRASVGFVGSSDGYTDLADGFQFDWQFDTATNGNIALTGEIDLDKVDEFTVGVAFGNTLPRALTTLYQSLASPFANLATRYIEQWKRPLMGLVPLHEQSSDEGRLFRTSVQMLLAHEDKIYPGALIASLAIPWGQAKGDEEGLGGYHLVWVRDMVQSALGLLAAGQKETPLRALIYLMVTQLSDGGFPQNFWVDGRPFWKGIQLDEVAFPILLAHRLWKDDALQTAYPHPMVRSAASFLLRKGPATQQERWEEVSGYSPSTLAASIAAIVCAAEFMRDSNDETSAQLLESFADWMEHNLENWTVTNQSTLVPGVTRHFVRINPVKPGEKTPDSGVADNTVSLTSRAPDEATEFLARDIVDTGFLELVRYGVRSADDPVIQNTIKVVDALLKVESPSGTCWHRYNNDGYGQRPDGGPYLTHGKGRGWPLLAGERGHYELAAKHDVKPFIRSLEGFATPTALLPEQVWDETDRPDQHLRLGRPTGSAVPLLWAHAEYIKLLRSTRDGRVFDCIPEVERRYQTDRGPYSYRQFWSFLYPTQSMERGHSLRVIAEHPFRLRWSGDGWTTQTDTDSISTNLNVSYADVATSLDWPGPLAFTFFWNESQSWEGESFQLELVDSVRS